MLEDFYAHSNFYELALLKLESKNLPEPFIGIYDFLFIDSKADDKRIANAKKTRSSNGSEISEPNIVTGFFVEEDTKVSLLHILENSVELYVDKLDIEPIMEAHRLFAKKKSAKQNNTTDAEPTDKNTEPPQVDTDAIDAIANFIEGLGDMISDYPTLDSIMQAKINEFTPTQISEKQFDFFTGNYYKNANRTLSPEAKQQAIYIINSVLAALYAAKLFKTALQIKDKYEQLKQIYGFIKIIFYIITAERQVVRIISKLLFLILDIVMLALPLIARKKLYAAINQKLKHFILERMQEYMDILKKQVVIDNISAIGGHAILAKDEQVDKKVTYDIVTKMSVFADTYMLDNIFRNYSVKNNNIQVADLKEDLTFLMHNPCLRGGATNMVYDDDENYRIRYLDFYTTKKLRTTSFWSVYNNYWKDINRKRINNENQIFQKFIKENSQLHLKPMNPFMVSHLPVFFNVPLWDLLDEGVKKALLKRESSKSKSPILSIVCSWQTFSGRVPMEPSPKASYSVLKGKNIESQSLDEVVIEGGLDWSSFFFRKDKLADIQRQLQESQDKVIALNVTSVLGDTVTMNEFVHESIEADKANTTLTPSSDERNYYSYFYNVYSQNKSGKISIAEAQAVVKKAMLTEQLVKEKYIKFINEYVQKTL